MTLPLQRFTHIGICVTDLDRSHRFYRDLLGFTEEHRLEIAGPPVDTLLRLRDAHLRAIYLMRDGVRIELLHFETPAAPARRERVMNEPGLTHLSFRVSDLDAVLDGLRAAGERVVEETVIRFPEFESAAAFVVDPDGQLIELVQAPGDPAAPPQAG
ncbi:MAG TPA: VOC family protein [Candidatus Binatia bacterium]|jgi:catechol 2,3-dioxygenase-like lactoylglutathione lyase family enzyme|nr:VOC family protein [Candidatus Binatia bacterium]